MTHTATERKSAPSLTFLISQARLADIHDCIALALDASERRDGYTDAEREARSYMRSALRQTVKMMEAGA